MRGTQLPLYILPADLAELEVVLRQRVPFVAVRGFGSDGALDIAESLQVERLGQSALRIYLVPSWLERMPEYFSAEVRGSDHIDITSIPAVEFDRCFLDATVLRQGRLYTVPTGFAPVIGDEVVVERFRRWVRSLFREARKTLIRQPDGSYIGRHALNAVSTDRLQLVAW